ncbi:MAG: hypothetical protein QME35_09785, partial [Thermoanaerobacteraceae bacterium]|nr:hypothetical protein [Thermoanaerobacteraceae bacterium]
LIISNASFQWFNHLDKTLDKLIRSLSLHGVLCFSTFGKNTFRELHEAFAKAREVLKISKPVYPGQLFCTLNELRGMCQDIAVENNLNNMKISAEEFYDYEYFDCCKDFLHSVKKIGANNCQINGNNIIPKFIEKVIEIYDKDYIENGMVKATYHNLFFYLKL